MGGHTRTFGGSTVSTHTRDAWQRQDFSARGTLSTLFPTKILTTALETYVSSSANHLGRASNDSRFATS